MGQICTLAHCLCDTEHYALAPGNRSLLSRGLASETRTEEIGCAAVWSMMHSLSHSSMRLCDGRGRALLSASDR